MWWIILLLFVLILIIACACDATNAALQRQIDDLKRTQERMQETEGWATAYRAPAEWGIERTEVLLNENDEEEEVTLEPWVVTWQHCHRDALYYEPWDRCPYYGAFVD